MLTDTLCEALTDFVTVSPSPQTDGEPVISAVTVIPVVLAGMVPVPLLYGAKHAVTTGDVKHRGIDPGIRVVWVNRYVPAHGSNLRD